MMLSYTSLRSQIREQPGALYLKIATTMRREINSGRWTPGYRLPALEKQAKALGVGLVTVRQAVALLCKEGLLNSKQGSGTFVSDAPETSRWLVLRSDWSSLIGHLDGKRPTLINVEESSAHPLVLPKEGTLTEAYRYMRRVHYWKSVAYAVIDIYLDRETYYRAPKDFDTNMVISMLAGLEDTDIDNLHQTFSFSSGDTETSALLGVAVNAPIGDVRRVITTTDQRILYVGEAKYRGDFVKLEMDLKR